MIYATDVATTAGTWSKTSDPTAAGNLKLTNRDDGVAALSAPLANPVNYFETTFDATGGTRYRVWFRIHAIGDQKWNDSFFVQFSDSLTSTGSPAYRIGTPGGYTVNLWTCADCQSFGWGWQRNAYWLADTGDVWFQNSGPHTIRVQNREDGVEIDQIVLSPVTYATNPPGPVSNDNTIVPKPTPPASPGAPSSPSPSSGATNVNTNAVLTWTSTGATTYDVKFGTANPPPQVVTGSSTASYTPALAAATTYFWQIVAHNAKGATPGATWSFTTAATPPPGGAVPAPWSAQDVGAVGRPGSASFSNGTFTVNAAGADIWGSADSFHYVSQAISDDTQIVARVTHIDNTNGFAKAGVMLRESLAANAAHVILALNPSGAIEFMTRSTTGGSTAWLSGASQSPPTWLRLVRSGSTVTGSVSSDGSSWATVGTTTLSIAASARVGLVVTSHDTGVLNTSTFDSVVVSTASAPPPRWRRAGTVECPGRRRRRPPRECVVLERHVHGQRCGRRHLGQRRQLSLRLAGDLRRHADRRAASRTSTTPTASPRPA